jgi:nucleotide-binding universal stress UspA family protein
MKKILVPIDFSASAKASAKVAAILARTLQSKIYLLHVVQAPSEWGKMSVATQQKYPDVENRMVEATIKIEKLSREKLFDGLEVTPVVRTGLATERIVDYATTQKINIIVMGAHGAGETDSLFVGSTAQRVIRLSPCSVISVKQNQDLSKIKQILFVSDFEEDISKALDDTIELATHFKAKLELAYINTPAKFKDTDSIEKAMNLALPEHSTVKINTTIYNHYERDKGILTIIDRINPQLVAIVTHGRKSKPLYQISVTDTLLFHSKVPILSFILKR